MSDVQPDASPGPAGVPEAPGEAPRPTGWRRPVAALEARDPMLATTRRAVRAAVIVPLVFALADLGIGNAQLSLFAGFGSIGFLIFANFGGPPDLRLRSYLALFVTGSVLIVLGTLCSSHPPAAVVGMAVVVFAVLLGGAASPQLAAGTTAVLLTFILPDLVVAPAGAIGDRLAGWALAAAFAIPAVMIWWPARWHDRLRQRVVGAARALSTLVAAHGDGITDPAAFGRAVAALEDLRAYYEATPYRPTGAGPDDAALSLLVQRLEWVGINARVDPTGPEHPTLALAEVRQTNAAAAEVLAGIGALVATEAGRSRPDPALARALAQSAAELEAARQRAAVAAVAGFVEAAVAAHHGSGPRAPGPVSDPRLPVADGASLLAAVDPTFKSRALAVATEMAAEAALGADLDDEGEGLAGRWARQRGTAERAGQVLRGTLDRHSVWLQNSVRGAAALAIAALVVQLTDVSHGFWVALGTLSVLRSNALGTGSTALRALGGTVVGFVVGSVIMIGLADHIDLLWALLPVAVLLAGVTPSMVSFAAGQAAFTVLVVILFNLLHPTGWHVGLLRVEDVAIGCAVSLGVGLLFWPRGATAALGRALGSAYGSAAALLLSAVQRISEPERPPSTAGPTAATALRQLDDAYRLYLSERGAKPVAMPVLTGLLTGATRIRLAAQALDALGPMPPADGPALPAVGTAGSALVDECRRAEQWYQACGTALARRGAVPPAPDHHDLGPPLLAALEESRQAARRDGLSATLRMLWAEERLSDLSDLETKLSGAATLFVEGLSGRPNPPK